MNKIILYILCIFSISIHATPSCTLDSSSTGIIADLRYMDVVVTAGSNQITAINGSLFTTADIGKLIAIKKGHHNPSATAEIPFTTPGRIVTVTAQILSVSTDGTSANINGLALNQDISTRAYVYTNNYDALQTLISSGGEITLNQSGIIGVNPFYHDDYTEVTDKGLVFPTNQSVTIRNTNNARIKLCSETIDWDYRFALFASQVSDHDMKIDISCIPPDEATTRWGGGCAFFTTTLFSVNGAGDSVRTIELKNTTPLASDIDLGTDPFWNSYYNGVKGGLEDNTNFQEIFILNDDPNAEIRTRNGGISQFGGGSQMTITNLNVNYSGHYIGENGRNFTSESIYTETDGGRWQFENFTISNGILKPMNPSTDFSWFDYVAPSRAMGVSINGSPFYQFNIDTPMEPNLADIVNGHDLDISSTGLSNTTNTSIVIQFHNDNRPPPTDAIPDPPSSLLISSNPVKTYGHPNYVHQDVAFDINNVTSMFGHWRYYANGDQYAGSTIPDIAPQFSIIRDSKILGTGLQFENFGDVNNGLTNQQKADVTRGTLQIENSEIIARRIFGNLILTDTNVVEGGFVFVNSLVSGGGNSFNFNEVIEVFNSDFMSVGDHYARGNKMIFSMTDVEVTFEETTFDIITIFPEVQNGTLHYLNITQPNSQTPRFDDNNATNFTEQTHIIFENSVFYNGYTGLDVGQDYNDHFLQFGFDENSNDGLFNGGKFTFINFPFKNHLGWLRLLRPNFSPDNINNGMFNVTTNSNSELNVLDFHAYRSLPYFFGPSEMNGVGVRTSESDKHKIPSIFKNIKIIVPTLVDYSSKFINIDWANGAYFNGEFDLKVTANDLALNPFFVSDNTNNKRNGTTLSNLVLKSSAKRHVNEIIRFEIDPKQNRVIEKEATIDGVVVEKYYVDTDPTGSFGLDGEIVYLEGDDSMSWIHQITHNDISDTPYTITPAVVDGHIEIDTGIYFSIKQELRSEDPWEDFEFELSNGSNEYHFINSATGYFASNSTPPRNVNPNYIKHFWTFQAYDSNDSPILDNGGNPILCYIENRTGKIIFNNTFSDINAMNTLTVTKGWEVTSYEWIRNSIVISPKVILQGAALNPNTGEEMLMRDDLRVNSYIPTTSPYSDLLSCDASVFSTTGSDAIVDWVYVELRDAIDNTIVIDGTSALLQRDGDVVGVDGSSSVTMNQPNGNYHIAIKHRNHLGIMTASPITLSGNVTSVDFTDANNQITYGSNAQTTSGMSTNVVAMWSGNVNGDIIVQYTGANPDAPDILSLVLNDPGNFLNFPTYIVTGYHTEDVNMDGNTQYTGTYPDTPFILQNVLAHPSNFLNFNTYEIIEQLPEN